VSGDYCDLVPAGDGADGFYFMIRDVSGKGVAASLLMAHLNAALRALARTGLPPQDTLEKADSLLAESTLTTHYATLVCGRANLSGKIEIANAGHCPPIFIRTSGSVTALNTARLPIGLAIAPNANSPYTVETVFLNDGDCLLLYTDGLIEAANSVSVSKAFSMAARTSAASGVQTGFWKLWSLGAQRPFEPDF
jgi:phosphoserine phosphatase RsbU/P